MKYFKLSFLTFLFLSTSINTGYSQLARVLHFDGSNDYVSLPNAIPQTITAGTETAFSIEYWFKGSNLQSAVRMQTASSGYIVAGWGTPGNQRHIISTDGGTTGIAVGANATDGNWHHIAVTWTKNKPNGFKSYLDGVLVEQRNSANVNLPSIGGSAYIGSFLGTSEFISGTIDKVRIWKSDRPQSSIVASMYSESVSHPSLVASYNFNHGIANTNNLGVTSLTDFSGNNYTGTLNNFALNGNTSNWTYPGPDPLNVSVAGANIGSGTYHCLGDAFFVLNNFNQINANINITISGDVAELTGGALLNGGAWTSMTIMPSAGSAKIVSGAVNPGSPLINLNGADNVTIDGVNSGGTSLTFSNTTVSSASNTSTILFQNDASNNVIRKCTILGSSITNFSNPCGTVILGSNPVTTGNDNNTISFCDIGPAGSNLPACAIYLYNPTASSLFYNNNDSIKNCNIYNYFNPTDHSSGIYAGTGNTAITIANNKLYQETGRAITTASKHHYGIQINNVGGNDFRITENTIGYSSSAGTGTYAISGATGSGIYGIYFEGGTSSESVISQNQVAAIGGSVLGGPGLEAFNGIIVKSGLTSVNNNNVTNIEFNSASVAEFMINGISNRGGSNWNTNSNTVQDITAATSGPCTVFGLRYAPTAGGSTWNCSTNVVGSLTNNSESIAYIYGISHTGTLNCNINSNTIQNIVVKGTTVATSGIVAGSGSHVIEKNTISSIANNNPLNMEVSVSGMQLGGGSGVINANKIFSLSLPNGKSSMKGIVTGSGSFTFSNNMISLGHSVSSGSIIRGMEETGGTHSFYFNSVLIGGNANSDTNSTYALYSTNGSARNYIDNIFYNSRSNLSSTGKHYAIMVAGSSPNPPGLISKSNDLYVSGTGGFVGRFNNADRSDLAAWKSATGQDSLSISANPFFVSNSDLHIDSTVSSPVIGTGIPAGGITTDFDGETRSSFPYIGADEDLIGITLNLTMFIEGFYNSGSNAQVSDTIKIHLRNSVSPYAVVSSLNKVVSSGGNCSAMFTGVSTGNYYIELTHRNTIETWSASPVSMSGSSNYDFSNSASQAFGNNMKQVDLSPVRHAVFSGDVNQDDAIDLTDIVKVFNDANLFLSGYVVTDVTGDSFVDLSDLTLTYNNSNAFVVAITP